MKREDIKFFNSWAKSFMNCSPAKVMQGLLYGIWIASNKDPEDIHLTYPRLLTHVGHPDVAKEFGSCPFEFSLDNEHELDENGKRIDKHRDINYYGVTWALDKYEMRKGITKRGLELAKELGITEEYIKSLVKKYGFNEGYYCEKDKEMYQEFLEERKNDNRVWYRHGNFEAPNIRPENFSEIRAAFCPNFKHFYNWCDNLDKAGITTEQIKFYEEVTGEKVFADYL